MPFKKGDPKPPNSGRQKGKPTKRELATKARLRETLAKHGVNVEDEIAKAIKKGDAVWLRTLQGLLPYLQPRIATEVKPSGTTPAPTEPGAEIDTAELLNAVKKE